MGHRPALCSIFYVLNETSFQGNAVTKKRISVIVICSPQYLLSCLNLISIVPKTLIPPSERIRKGRLILIGILTASEKFSYFTISRIIKSGILSAELSLSSCSHGRSEKIPRMIIEQAKSSIALSDGTSGDLPTKFLPRSSYRIACSSLND